MSISSNSSRRLITQNLLVSAARHELGEKASWNSVHDLSVLIEAVCLYDRLIVLGRQAYGMMEPLRKESQIFEAVDGVIDALQPLPNEEEELVAATCGHLGAFLNERSEVDRFRPLIEALFEPETVRRAFAVTPDSVGDFRSGEEWIRTVPNEVNLLETLEKDAEFHRGTTFLVRTFLYLAYADINRLPLTPDQTRARVLEPIVRSERRLRSQLLEKLGEGFRANYLGREEVRRHISPLASVVFDRARGKKENIAEEMLRLRRELTPLRDRLGEVDVLLASELQGKEAQVIRAWNRVFEEIQGKYGAGKGIVSLEDTLSFAGDVGKVVAKPKDPGTWFKPLALPLEAVRKVFARRPVVEIHRLQFPSTDRLQASAQALFGHLREEPQQ